MNLFVASKTQPSNWVMFASLFSHEEGLQISSSCLGGTVKKGWPSTSHQHWVFVKSVTRGNSHRGIWNCISYFYTNFWETHKWNVTTRESETSPVRVLLTRGASLTYQLKELLPVGRDWGALSWCLCTERKPIKVAARGTFSQYRNCCFLKGIYPDFKGNTHSLSKMWKI